MKRPNKIILILIIILVGNFFAQPGIIFGQNGYEANEIINKEIKDLNSDIDGKKTKIKKLQQRQDELSAAIKQKHSEKASLANQLAILDNRVAKAELDIVAVELDIERTNLEIQKTDIEIETKNKEIDKEKYNIANVLRLIQKRDNVSSLEIMLLNDSLADFLSQAKYLEDVNESIEESLDYLGKVKIQLVREKKSLDEYNIELDKLKTKFEDKKKELSSQIDTKVSVLSQVKTSERQYQRLLAEAKEEQEAAAAEIASIEKLVRAKIAKLDGEELGFNDNGFIWPVPKNVITAYFHDPDYPFRYIFEHPAIDIRAAQGTILKAAASGYVARTKAGADGGYGYIMLIHGDGLSTVYGHVSSIAVKEDEYVTQGQTIGRTGGLPGTPGAGRLTTGPHLHFEIRLNGIPVDPLSYLP